MTTWEKGAFKASSAWHDLSSIPSWKWWAANFKLNAPELAYVAIRCRAAYCSMHNSEGIWSEFAYVYGDYRHRLGVQKASDILFCYHNLKLLRKNKRQRGPEPTLPPSWYPEEDLELEAMVDVDVEISS
jgi:hypothetical protein